MDRPTFDQEDRPVLDPSATRERAHLDRLYLEIFDDDKRGALILADLHRRFVKKPDTDDFSQAGVLKVFTQSHQREVLEYIVRRVNRARGVHDEPPPDGNEP